MNVLEWLRWWQWSGEAQWKMEGLLGVWGWDLDPFCSSKRMALISLKDEQEKLPAVFLGGKYVGGAEEIKEMNESGELSKLIGGLPAAYVIPCNVNGLIKCGICYPVKRRDLEFFFSFLLYQNFIFCWSLNDEGLALLKFRERIVSDPYDALKNWKDEDGVVNPCYWFGVECSDGKVVELNLKDLYLGGTLAPDLRNLVRIKSIILHNNSFTGIIPEGIGELKELEGLDFGNNNFSGPLPPVLDSSLSLTILFLDNNRLLSNLSPEIHRLETHSEFQVDENQLASAAKGPSYNERSALRNAVQTENAINKRQLQVANAPRVNESPYLRSRFSVPEAPSESGKAPPRSVAPPFSLLPSPPVNNSIQSPPPEPNPAPSSPPAVVSLPTPLEPNPPSASPNGSASNPLLVPTPPSSNNPRKPSSSKKHVSIIAGAIGGALLAMSIVIFYVYKINKATVKPIR
ncbi:protein MALE DISCOVERER 2-like [Manihot esculenta]|uniref:protein MALE DISCOVERER 2-like n=1 Tax=Manihot esculenta TaxID=3983 RepID=UPI001CC52B36|nr:protein MALE DISCOVERER 2-like [Manihot esculenta]